MKSIKIRTLYTFIITQTLISILFYLGDNFVSAGEAVITFILGIGLTYLIEFLREIKDSKDSNNSQDDQ
jgi:hypothetical protein